MSRFATLPKSTHMPWQRHVHIADIKRLRKHYLNHSEIVRKDKYKLKIGDLVESVSGKLRGTQGEVSDIDYARGLVVVHNMKLQSIKMRDRFGRLTSTLIERPVHYSTLNLVDPVDGMPTRVSLKRIDGKRCRVSDRTGFIFERINLLKKSGNKEKEYRKPIRVPGPKDTPVEFVTKWTYKPSLSLFKESILRSLASKAVKPILPTLEVLKVRDKFQKALEESSELAEASQDVKAQMKYQESPKSFAGFSPLNARGIRGLTRRHQSMLLMSKSNYPLVRKILLPERRGGGRLVAKAQTAHLIKRRQRPTLRPLNRGSFNQYNSSVTDQLVMNNSMNDGTTNAKAVSS